jgi:cardiolipin synthase (CMP-forming)
MSLRHLPNLLCLLRILMVYPVAHSILTGRYPAVMALFAVAAFTDALDGFLAKRFGWTSELGKVLDPLADKLLLLTVFICLSIVGIAPWWLTALVLLRDLVIVFGALTFKVLFGPLRGAPTAASKINTFFQIVFCLAAVSEAAYAWPGMPVVIAAGAMVVLTTSVSGIDYVLIYIRRAVAVSRARAAAARWGAPCSSCRCEYARMRPRASRRSYRARTARSCSCCPAAPRLRSCGSGAGRERASPTFCGLPAPPRAIAAAWPPTSTCKRRRRRACSMAANRSTWSRSTDSIWWPATPTGTPRFSGCTRCCRMVPDGC